MSHQNRSKRQRYRIIPRKKKKKKIKKNANSHHFSEAANESCSYVQVELTGNSIYEYIYPEDRNEMISVLSLPATQDQHYTYAENSRGEIELERAFLLRMKCILAKRNAGLVTEGYKVQ